MVVCDGYSAYRKQDGENPDITFAGCWTHARRYFSDALKALPKAAQKTAKDTVAYEALRRIGAICHLDNQLSDLKADERKKQRQMTVKPLAECVGKRGSVFRTSFQRENTGRDQLLYQSGRGTESVPE